MRFTDNGAVLIEGGRDVLQFSPTEVAPEQFSRDQLNVLSHPTHQERAQWTNPSKLDMR